ncbi:MAG: baseplate multidomain protein megatron, partial [Alterinioella nitratireducens]|uniref:baseplate multidomain protein megatron n=1 Tax=Alterinioella nitratireducens TaxID=2735915 RepID=UPI0040587C1E
MATILLSAAGAAIGGLSSGTVLGLTGAVVGRAVGATLGRVIDQRLMGQGSEVIEQGKMDRFRLTGAAEGAPVARLFGQMRLGGQVIWATRFKESIAVTGGGKGAPPQPRTASYSYSVSLAVALCEGEIARVGRVWADGAEIAQTDITMRVYRGTDDQMPDPKMEAVEGVGMVPAYRGIAYVVIEDLDLTPYGNRVPQFSFEVIRPASPAGLDSAPQPSKAIRAVAMMPGTGEYALATTAVSYAHGFGKSESANVNTASGEADFLRALDNLQGELPNCGATSLIVSWFGDDLRAGQCSVKPKVEQNVSDGAEMPWSVAGLTRSNAELIARVEDRVVYGGTPADASVIEAIEALNEAGQDVMFYPFLLMEILEGNGLPDPWRETGGQPVLPWRGRITGEKAPGIAGSPDRTAAADAEVAAFFGTASASDFTVSAGSVTYSGPSEWRYRRFILHCAALAAAAGGVESFCIGSEMRSLTQLRGASGFPAVQALIDLAAEVRQLLPDAKLSYAADWSEYFGYHPQDGSGDVFFHLDALWADANIDFVGIDNYMPLSDWRDGEDHADAGWRSIYNLDYLKANIEGGEGYDWYYGSVEAREAQRRSAISGETSGLRFGAILEEAAPGPSEIFGFDHTDETVTFVTQIPLPVVPEDGTVWEHGGKGRGVWVGVRDGGNMFRLRAGDGNGPKTGSDDQTAVLDILTAD